MPEDSTNNIKLIQLVAKLGQLEEENDRKKDALATVNSEIKVIKKEIQKVIKASTQPDKSK
jgi:hypothetical protein